MNLLSRLFRRRGTAAPADPAAAIDHALASAGLHRGSGPAGAIRSTIDRSLADAGLRRPSTAAPPPDAPNAPAPSARRDDGARERGRFLEATYANAHGRRDYRLYVPAGYDGRRSLPLVLVLHGCTQSAEDFAVGTRWNALADRHGILVAYPQQQAKENHAKCWNWFRPEDQRRDAGEPSILAGIVAQVGGSYRVDPERVFAAGLSAGGAMAVVLAHAYPDVFRAIGVHSGLPYAHAHDVPSAFAAMQGRAAAADRHRLRVPLIVFHGDRDRTVAPVNADLLLREARAADLAMTATHGRVPGGRAFTRERYVDAQGAAQVERWTVHGAGHAWSGGSANGSYTDPEGPDASAEMLRFFLEAGRSDEGASTPRG